MIELQRQILLPPQSAGPSGQATGTAVGLPVPFVTPARPPGARDDRHGAMLSGGRQQVLLPDDDGAPAAADRRTQGRLAGPGLPGVARDAGRQGAIGSLAFLAQRIFQEQMPSGLHLEPWAQGIGAYRRAGAEPPLGIAGAALVSLAI